jgi:hypothetical protein
MPSHFGHFPEPLHVEHAISGPSDREPHRRYRIGRCPRNLARPLNGSNCLASRAAGRPPRRCGVQRHFASVAILVLAYRYAFTAEPTSPPWESLPILNKL